MKANTETRECGTHFIHSCGTAAYNATITYYFFANAYLLSPWCDKLLLCWCCTTCFLATIFIYFYSNACDTKMKARCIFHQYFVKQLLVNVLNFRTAKFEHTQFMCINRDHVYQFSQVTWCVSQTSMIPISIEIDFALEH